MLTAAKSAINRITGSIVLIDVNFKYEASKYTLLFVDVWSPY